MKRVPSKITDICVASYFFNKLNKNTTTWTTTTAQHYWYISAPGGDPTKVKTGKCVLLRRFRAADRSMSIHAIPYRLTTLVFSGLALL